MTKGGNVSDRVKEANDTPRINKHKGQLALWWGEYMCFKVYGERGFLNSLQNKITTPLAHLTYSTSLCMPQGRLYSASRQELKKIDNVFLWQNFVKQCSRIMKANGERIGRLERSGRRHRRTKRRWNKEAKR
jgi:hypothetical protein